jgi:hypothetical protein
MTAYVRPEIEPAVFTDADGEPIRYGHRWGVDSPPSDSYSVTSNLERFRPLHRVADALVDWLSVTYDASIEDDPAAATDLIYQGDDVARAVRVTPADQSAATITFVYTDFPGIRIHAGMLHDFHFPVCGCDACDETWERCADDLEWTVRTIVTGGYSEAYLPDRDLSVSFRLVEPGCGSSGGQSRAEDLPAERLDRAASALTPRRAWRSWSKRRTSSH